MTPDYPARLIRNMRGCARFDCPSNLPILLSSGYSFADNDVMGKYGFGSGALVFYKDKFCTQFKGDSQVCCISYADVDHLHCDEVGIGRVPEGGHQCEIVLKCGRRIPFRVWSDGRFSDVARLQRVFSRD